ncbi:hypothetical protein PAESOLCIP111_06469 [Paenibacillus solanacearum]|uniref:Probable membrane transporter protein n=1 Tax=Paenibacillus solanacearum TaxID=2048548 RepID=A0A916NLU7_9BACL|nr:sulfite exporter TauE/SafE family protein [Paenibacillus solanacearum]CAG7652153.1 hypothetical protein PAESOLCIP111_06469 [Paenibacillus solanacearum]
MDQTIILGILVIILAAFVQGLTSFGFALISVPLLTKILPLQQVVPIVVILSLISNISVLFKAWKHVDLRKIWILLISSLVAAPMGTLLLMYTDPSIIKIIIGFLILLSSIAILQGKSFSIRNERVAFVPVGVLSGLLNGSVGLSGPPVALFLSNQGVDKQTFRANITAYAFILNIITICTYFYSGLLNIEVALYLYKLN